MTIASRFRLLYGLILILSSFSAVAQDTTLTRFHGTHAAMGTQYRIDLYATNEARANQIMQDCFDEVDRIEALLSNYRPLSELSRISQGAATGSVTTDPETFAFLKRAFSWSRRTGGAFDMTVAPLMRVWGFFYEKGHVPAQSRLDTAANQIGWQHVLLDPAARSVTFADHRKMELDPGGIGKGYAVDRIVLLMKQEQVAAALISAGSSTIYALGAPPQEAGWIVHIPDLEDTTRTLSTVTLKDTSLSTSACTEKFFVQDGHRYCHILDPRSMRPVEGMLQTTIIAPSATDSDALSTATFVLRGRESAVLLQNLPEVAALLVEGMIKHPVFYTTRWPDASLAGSNTTPEKGPTP